MALKHRAHQHPLQSLVCFARQQKLAVFRGPDKLIRYQQVGAVQQEPVDVHASQEAKGLALALTIIARPMPAADSPETVNAVYIGDHQVSEGSGYFAFAAHLCQI